MDYMYAQVWTLNLLAFLFGPLLPSLFIYAFFGFIILDTTVRLRIAYSVKRFPNYDDSLNQTNMIMISFSAYFYSITASELYSNKAVFENKVSPNKSASVYNSSFDDLAPDDNTILTPGIIFSYFTLAILILSTYYLLSYLFYSCCPAFDYFPKCCLSRNWKLNKKVIVKRLPNFYAVLSNEQSESMLIEEVQTRKRTGI